MVPVSALLLAAIEPPPIVVTGQRLEDGQGDERAGAIVITAERMLESASGRIEGVLATVPGLQSFRRNDSRSANPSAQGLTLLGLGGNASSRTLVLLDGIPIDLANYFLRGQLSVLHNGADRNVDSCSTKEALERAPGISLRAMFTPGGQVFALQLMSGVGRKLP